MHDKTGIVSRVFNYTKCPGKSKRLRVPLGTVPVKPMNLSGEVGEVLEDCFQKRFSSEGDHGSFSLAPNFLAELTHGIKLEIQGRGSRKVRKAFL